jgi:hypothetical protein
LKQKVAAVMSDEFDTILDRCLADLAAGRETIDSCLRQYPAQAGRLAALLPLAERARALPPPAPFPLDKRRALESKLLKEAGRRQTRSASRPLWRRRSVFAVMSLVLSVLILFSAVGVSTASVPGDILYPIKRTAEQVRLALVPNQEQAAVHLELAQVRLRELDILAQRGEVSTGLLTEIEAETNLVLERAAWLPAEQQNALLTRMMSFQDEQVLVLESVALRARGAEQTQVKAALNNTAARRLQVKDLLTRSGGSAADPTRHQEQGPLATVVGSETPPAPGNSHPSTPSTEPELTKEPGPEETARPTKVHPATPQKSTPRAERTPPGQENKATKEPKSTKEPKK